MRNHQFAIQSTTFAQIIKELTMIHFLDVNSKKLTPIQLFTSFLKKSLVNFTSSTVKAEQLANFMATNKQDAATYLKDNKAVTVLAFYNVALQLLHFEVHLDFELEDPIAAMRKINLPLYDSRARSEHLMTSTEIIKAWYLLLNTHTKNGQTFLDDLSSNGYLQQFSDLPKPCFFNGKAQPVFDTKHMIHETVYIEAPLNTDHTNKRDLLRCDIIRPGETNHGIKVPTLFTASPYNLGINDEGGVKMTHHVNVPLKHKQPNHLTYQDIESHDDPTQNLPAPRTIKAHSLTPEVHFQHEWTYSLNDYFLARGFAIVYSAGVGTRDSDGFRTTGSKAETIGAEWVIKWLTGKATAFTNRHDQIATKAFWSNQRVGMTGRSYLGTLSQATATTGVKGLKTVIVEAGISNWYDYYRDHGLVAAPGGFQGEDCDVLAEETNSRQKNAGDFHRNKVAWQRQLAKITQGQDRSTGDYNQFWDARNYLKDIKNAKATYFIVHGLNDINVKPRNAYNLWQHLQELPNVKKLILHQGQHIYINDFQSIDFTDQVNLWISNQLYGVHNDALKQIPDVQVQDNVKPQTWHTYRNWGHSGQVLQLNLKPDTLTTQDPADLKLSYQDQLPAKLYHHYCHYQNQWEQDVLAGKDALKGHELIFKTAPLQNDLRIDGVVKLHLQIASSTNLGLISARLVDYGRAKRLTISPQVIAPQAIYQGYQWRKADLRDFKFQKHPTNFKPFSMGYLNLQNRENNYRTDDLQPDQFYPITVTFQPTMWHLLKGHQLGLVVYGPDFQTTVRGNQDIKYTLDLKKAHLDVPKL